MISFDVLTLKAFTGEQKFNIEGARINKIQQPTRREFIFTLRINGKSEQLYVNIHPEFYHICFMNDDTYNKRILSIPKKPPMFCMLLRKYLENSKIISVNLPDNERILEFNIETSNSIGESISLCLAMEFMGKHSNVILYEKGNKNIIGCAHNVGSDKSREREVYGGIPYIYPPSKVKSDIQNCDGEICYENLYNDFYMFSKYFAGLCKDKPLEKIKSYVRVENISPAISRDYSAYCLYSELLGEDVIRTDSVNSMIDLYYSHHIYEHKFKELQNRYKTIVQHDLNRLTRSQNSMKASLLKYKDSEKFRLFGDLLMANMYNLSDYSPEVTVYDYENDRNITVPLDETKTIKDNANRFYKLYNKSKTAKQKLSEFIEKGNQQRAYIAQLLYSIDSAQTPEDLYEIAPEVTSEQTPAQKSHTQIPFIELEDGTRIYIGKNNKQNDYIISKLASDDDIWFHVHNNAGSHVLLKTQNLTDELIMRCARLAKDNSSVKDSSKIGVIYTKRKYLRKPPAANLGYVTYKNEKEIILD